MLSGITDLGIPSDWLILTVFVNSTVDRLRSQREMRYGCDVIDSTSRHAEFELATNTALSDFPNVEAKREEQRNCLKHLVRRIVVFAILPTGFGKSFIFQLFPQIKRALE